MPAATDLRKDVLRSVHRRLNDLARCIALRSESHSPASQPSHRRDADPFGPLFNVLEALNSEQKGFHTRLEQLEDALSPAAAPAARGRRVRPAH
ncbi:hypothetical protein [Streptomyces sp. NBC_00829]|uniref:hypothetical protein n=1 Tax=Streptomyces sp. NBC_00829 TaxID=2903679 RepID=UPI00386AA1CE|nr:hypothetical protein OG293_33145 [Streptomyces sp. NBC_00829]